MAIKRYYIRIYGIVQGVGFRYFAYRLATNMGISGYVKNMPDESVEIEAEGPEGILEEFIRRVEEGPPAAVVEKVIKEEIPATGEKGFEIRH
uniref:acylphosphatase n=1 Tax=candidate division WOR-3 bacterium TaxID=2052148 RepID=A0A7C2PLJ7_UNCW3